MKQPAPLLPPKLVMIDRDGTLTEEIGRDITKPEDLHLVPRAAQAVALLNQAGIPVVMVSNQEVVGRGEIDDQQLERINQKLRADLAVFGAKLDGMFICTDNPKHPTHCHKPGSGMLVEALERFRVRPEQAPMIGDELADLQAAAGAGCPRLLVCTGAGAKTARELPVEVLPVGIHNDLYAAVLSLLGDRAPTQRPLAGAVE
jgi:D-glycero-D-manno-heptose 1,7-bisphosphate phosphatase